MEKVECLKMLKDLELVYVSSYISTEKLELYCENLMDIEAECIEKGLKELLQTRESSFFPTIAEIRFALLKYKKTKTTSMLQEEKYCEITEDGLKKMREAYEKAIKSVD